MKNLVKGALFLFFSASVMHASSLTIGSPDSGNCYPFMCNDSGTSAGPSMTYQQDYLASSFPGAVSISALSYTYWPFAGPPVALGGTYSFYWGYSATGLALGSNFASNFSSGDTLFDTAVIPAGGVNFGTTLTFGFTPFTYNPALGDLLLEVDVTNQDNVPNSGANGYAYADYTGLVTDRNYSIGGGPNGTGADPGALDTTFTYSPAATPEPSSLTLLATGLAGVSGIIRRKLSRRS